MRKRREPQAEEPKQYRLILPAVSAFRDLSETGERFLNDYEIYVTGLVQELIRLVYESKERFTAEKLQDVIGVRHFINQWESLHAHVYPKYTRDEALDRWLAIVTTMYFRLETIIREAMYDIFPEVTGYEVIVKEAYRYHDDMMIVIELDRLPF